MVHFDFTVDSQFTMTYADLYDEAGHVQLGEAEIIYRVLNWKIRVLRIVWCTEFNTEGKGYGYD